MIEKLREVINNDKELKELLNDCSDDFLLENAPLILKAASGAEALDGMKIKLSIVEGELNWEYIPIDQENKELFDKWEVKSKYAIKLPEHYSKYYSLDINKDFNWNETNKVVREYLKVMDPKNDDGTHKGFWITGNPNTGKSILLISMLNELAKSGLEVSYIKIGDLIELVMNTFNSFQENYASIVESIKKINFLVIDDMDAVKPSTWFKENVLLSILDFRATANLPTFFASTKNKDAYMSTLKGKSENVEHDTALNGKIIARINNLAPREFKI